MGYSWGVVGRKFSHRPGNPATVGAVRWPAAGDTAGSSLRRLSSLQHRIYNLLGSASRRQRPSAVSRLKAGRAWSELAGRRRCSAASAATQHPTLRALSLSAVRPQCTRRRHTLVPCCDTQQSTQEALNCHRRKSFQLVRIRLQE